MNTLTFPLSVALETPTRRTVSADPYASGAQTDALLRSGAAYRRERIQAADMITTDEAAELTGASRVTINAWIKAGRCIGVSHLRRGFKLPRWQFEPFVFPHLQPLSQALQEYPEQAVPYREIHDLTQVSVTTIGRVARTLERGAGGYATAVQRQQAATASASH